MPQGFDEENGMMFDRLMVDNDLVETLQFTLLDGRDFSPDFSSDIQDAALINETAVKALKDAGADATLKNNDGKSYEEVARNIEKVDRGLERLSKSDPIITPGCDLFFSLAPQI